VVGFETYTADLQAIGSDLEDMPSKFPAGKKQSSFEENADGLLHSKSQILLPVQGSFVGENGGSATGASQRQSRHFQHPGMPSQK
jgi:hypothetical protein